MMRKWILFCLLLFGSAAIQSQSEELKISGNYQGQSLLVVLDDLEARYGLYFYFDDQFPINRTVNATVENLALSQAIPILLNDSALGFEMYGSTSVILAEAARLNTQYNQDFFQARQAERERALSNDLTESIQIITIGDSSSQILMGR